MIVIVVVTAAGVLVASALVPCLLVPIAVMVSVVVALPVASLMASLWHNVDYKRGEKAIDNAREALTTLVARDVGACAIVANSEEIRWNLAEIVASHSTHS